MSIESMLLEMKALNEKIESQIRELNEDRAKLLAEIQELDSQIIMIDEELHDKEAILKTNIEKLQFYNAGKSERDAQFQAAQNAFATLFTKYKAGGITDADFAQFSQASGIDIPVEEGEEDSESETEELEQTGT